jgi:hypothetical protein
MAKALDCVVMPDRDDSPLTEAELRELRNNLAKLSGPSVVEFYKSVHRDCSVERKPSAKAIQKLVTAWKILRRWNWR